MKRSDFYYELPAGLIAQRPLTRRTDSRLMTVDITGGFVGHHRFAELPSLLHTNDLLVFNDTRVIPARLFGRKETGGKLEILVERLIGTHTALVQIRASKSPRPGTAILLSLSAGAPAGPHRLQVAAREGDLYRLSSEGGMPFASILAELGHMPLPPYIERADEPMDRERYQTVYGRREGAVAAPTAGLHFSRSLLEEIDARGIRRASVTLHVGAGTFQPVREEDIERHSMHAEYLEVDDSVCAAVAETRARGGRVVAVGTTAVRALETASAPNGELQPRSGDTDIFIFPGYRFRCVDAMVTNFHLPESSLLMLVSAFAGRDLTMRAYASAIESGYRFFSYGDAMFIAANQRLRSGS